MVDIAPVPNKHDFGGLLDAMSELEVEHLERRSEADEALAKRVPDLGLRQFLLQNLVRGDYGYRWRINVDAIRANMGAILDSPVPDGALKFESPALFVRGGNSNYIREEHEEDIRRLFPCAELVTIEGAGHWLHTERPQRFLEEIRAFLSK